MLDRQARHNNKKIEHQKIKTMTTIVRQQQWSTTGSLLLAYFTFGALHELAHLLTASWLLGRPLLALLFFDSNNGDTTSGSIILRIILGRCITIPLSIDHHQQQQQYASQTTTTMAAIITHSGWITSLVIAILCHLLYKQQQQRRWPIITSSPIIPVAAYLTALEGMTTDLLGFVPHHHGGDYLTFFCGNFGILLMNSSWLSIDGGRTALDVLEKMVSLEKKNEPILIL